MKTAYKDVILLIDIFEGQFKGRPMRASKPWQLFFNRQATIPITTVCD